jgi:hypothetical protein
LGASSVIYTHVPSGLRSTQGKFVLRDRYRILIDFGPSGGVHSHGLI